MSGGEPSSIKQKPSCAADLPILSPKCGKAAGCVYSNYLCAVLWGAERISIETTLSIEGDVPSLRLGQIPAGQKFLPMVETAGFCGGLCTIKAGIAHTSAADDHGIQCFL